MTAPAPAWHPPNTVGDIDPNIVKAKQYLRRFSYGQPANDGTPLYTEAFGEALRTFQSKRNDEIARGAKPGPRMNRPGWLDYDTKVQLEIEPRAGGANPPPPHLVTDSHFLSAPGSGVDWWVGPPFNMGEWLKDNAGVHHWPCGYPKGGYLGLMGGDSGQSYIDTIALEAVEFERRIREDILPGYGVKLQPGQAITDAQVASLPASFKLMPCGYSQSADGIIQACAKLFGEGGVFEALRPKLVGIVAFGNPARQGGPTRYGRNPKGKGISGYVAPPWLAALIIDIVTETPTAPDFYACNTSEIAAIAYDIVVRAETQLPFIVYLGKVIIPTLLKVVTGAGGLLGGGGGGLFGGLSGLLGNAATIPLLSGLTGLSGGQLVPIVNAAQTDDGEADAVAARIAAKLSLMGIVMAVPELIGLLMALPGIQTHGLYEQPQPEFGGLSGVQVALNLARPLL
ncbi:lysin B [Mycobacterium phage Quesadilla]|uniref:Lysin B n=1 Tax=Mycobacterium phage Quesadilla TaxID=2664226 RepID=A0A5Q2WD45_9CAUD|nr:lysin B [Mycobacterium phage Quesadilla]QGH75298.1 lysin B [Mycobacterium phage Quesadilla]